MNMIGFFFAKVGDDIMTPKQLFRIFLVKNDMNLESISRLTGYSKNQLCNAINGRCAVTLNMATALKNLTNGEVDLFPMVKPKVSRKSHFKCCETCGRKIRPLRKISNTEGEKNAGQGDSNSNIRDERL